MARTADKAEIRRAYHQAARRWHPDRYGEAPPPDAARAEIEMRRVNDAWQVLGEAGRRRAYDRELSGQLTAGRNPQSGVTAEGGVIRIDPRLLDPEFVQARRHAQLDEISNRNSVIVRVAPVVVLLGLLVAIFVFTAYARRGTGAGGATTMPGPNLGAGIEAGDCVSVLTGPALLDRPCDASARGRVIGARLPEGVCPLGTTEEVDLTNGATACLAPVG